MSDRELPELADGTGLPQYLEYAALNNPGLEAAFNRWKAALEKVPQVKALPDPRFSYRYYIQAVETRVGAQRQGFAISQTFPWLGKLEAKGNAALEAADVKRKAYEAEKLALFYDVKEAYYEYHYLWRAISILDENIQLLQNIETVLRTRYKAAAASHPAVIRAQVELGKLDDRLSTLRDLREPVVARLNAALNRPANAPLPWPDRVEDPMVTVNDDELLIWLQQTNPQIQALDFEIAKSEHEIELAKQQYIPDVTLGLDYIDTADSTGGRSPSDDGKDAVIAGVSVNVPIWFGKLSAGVREAKHQRLAAVYQKAQTVNTLSARLKMVTYRFRDADRRINLYRDTLLPKAEESLKATLTAFQGGKASFTDMIDAQRLLLEFQLSYERGLSDKIQRLAELEMLTGQQIAENGSVQPEPVPSVDGEDRADAESDPDDESENYDQEVADSALLVEPG